MTTIWCVVALLACSILLTGVAAGAPPAAPGQPAADLWELAQANRDVHRFSTLFMAGDMRDRLASDSGIDRAIDWCRQTGVTKVYVETYRDGYQADRSTLEHARDRLAAAGLVVSGCVTPTMVGKESTGWKPLISCYTDPATQERVQEIFTFAASLFDEVMIDDFWFTDCACSECDRARTSQVVRIGNAEFPVRGATWADYRCELMVQLSRSHVLAAARNANPRCRLIIKYPQWYEQLHERGYDVVRQTADFPLTWVGTETRDFDDSQWGGTPQYEAFFIMRWLGGIGDEKCGGGWYDALGTTAHTYIEQARQTVLGGARESMLFAYGLLQNDTGPANVQALQAQMPDLLDAARQVAARRLTGIAAWRPPGANPAGDKGLFGFAGMIGLPLAPCHEFPADAPAIFVTTHGLSDPALREKLDAYIATGRPVLISSLLASRLSNLDTSRGNVHVLQTRGRPELVMSMPRGELGELRDAMLAGMGVQFDAPAAVSLYLFEDGSAVIESFRNEPVEVVLNGRTIVVEPRGWVAQWSGQGPSDR